MTIIKLLSCDAARPDRRAIANMLEEVADGMSAADAREQTEYLLDGEEIEIEVSMNTSSAFRAIRKCNIDYEIVE